MLIRNFTFKVSSQSLAALMAFVSLLVMTRYVAHEYGVMVWGLALVSLVNTVADLGFNSANLKFIAKEGYDRSACFSTYMVIKAALTGIMIIGTVATVAVMRATDIINEEAFWVCLVFVIYQIISNVQFAIYYTLDGMMMSGKSSILTIVECSIRNQILIIMALWHVDAVTLSWSYVIATAVSGVLSLWMARSVGLKYVRPAYLHEYAVFAMPLAAALILTSVVSNLDKVVVGLYYPSIEVTYYSTAVGLIAAFTAVGVSLNNVLLPHLSKNLSNNEVAEHTLWGLERGLCIILCPFIVFFIVFGARVGSAMFGPGFGPSGQMVAVLSIQIIPFVFAGIMTQVLYAIDKGVAYLKASVILCVTAIVGFAITIPGSGAMPFCLGLGGIGAAASVSLAYVLYSVALILMVRKYTGIRLYSRLWTIMVASLGAALVLFAINELLDIYGIMRLFLCGLICEVVFIGILALMKEFTKKDVYSVLSKLKNDED